MPSHTSVSALIKLFFAVPGAPWTFPRWQEITGVDHGLNPKDDNNLPSGLSRADATHVDSYFSRYNAQPSEDDKIKFASTARKNNKDPCAGRQIWQTWVNARYSPQWKINSRISKILSSLGLHPQQIMAENGESTPPSSASYLPLALDAIGLDLFGPEALDNNKRLITKLREPTLILAQCTWRLEIKSMKGRKKRVEKLREKAETILSGLDQEKPNVKAINAAIRAVASFERAVVASMTSQYSAELQTLKDTLDPFIPALDTPKSGVKRVARARGKPKVTKEAFSTYATPEEVSQLMELYDQYFSPEAASAEELDLDTETQGVTFGEPVEGADPGVEVEANMPSTQLSSNLGFQNDMPFLFNNFRHTGGLSAWSKEFEDAMKSNPDVLEAFSLQWHQLAGVHAAVRKILSPSPNPARCTGVLFADDVGLGKTIQASTVMAFFSNLSIVHERNLTLPPIARDLPFLKDLRKIPHLPHLVVVPGTLLRQWEHELQCFFKHRSVDILMYGTRFDEHREFWKADGIYHGSHHVPPHRIILASHSALQTDFSHVYTNQRSAQALPWDHPEPSAAYDGDLKSTLFGQQYLTVVIDEAQTIRNPGTKHSAALRVLEEASIHVILTATPLQTSTKDISSMGRLTGIPHFFTQQAQLDQAADNAKLRRARLEREENSSLLEQDTDPVKQAQIDISKELSSKFEGRVIRRTAKSRNPQGRDLISLPKLTVIDGVLELRDREKGNLEKITLDGLADASEANSRCCFSTTFYLDHRMGVILAREDPSQPIPVFKSLEEWTPVRSTKIHNLVGITKHFLMRDDMPCVDFVDGEVVYPPAPTTPDFTRDVKVLVYQDFTCFTPLVKNIYELEGIKPLAITGSTSFEQRAKIVTRFNNDSSARVLIISRVGSMGLNLTRASIIIFLDQPWSAQDEKQIIGRAWRQRQERDVLAIHLLAADTADITLSSLARGKKDMLDAFLRTDTSKALMRVMTGEVIRNEEDDDEDESPINKTTANGPKPAKKKASKVTKAPKETGDQGKGKGKGRSKAKSAPVITDEAENVPEPSGEGTEQSASVPQNDFFVPSADSEGIDDASTAFYPPTDVSMHESGSELYETDLSMHAPSTHDAYDSSSSRIDDLSRYVSDEEMGDDTHPRKDVLENVAKKRARAPSSPPPITSRPFNRSVSALPTSPQQLRHDSVIKRARLGAQATSTPGRGTPEDENPVTSPLLGALFPPLSSFEFDEPPSPNPLYSSPTPYNAPSISQKASADPFSAGRSLQFGGISRSLSTETNTVPEKRRGDLPEIVRSRRTSEGTDTRDHVDNPRVSSSILHRKGGLPDVFRAKKVAEMETNIPSHQESGQRSASASSSQKSSLPAAFRQRRKEGQSDTSDFSDHQMPPPSTPPPPDRRKGRMDVNRQPTAFSTSAAQPSGSRMPPPVAPSRPNPRALKAKTSKSSIPRR